MLLAPLQVTRAGQAAKHLEEEALVITWPSGLPGEQADGTQVKKRLECRKD